MFRTDMVAKITIAVLFVGQSSFLARGQTLSYSITDLGTLGGATSTACGINDLGQVAGKSAIATGQLHAFLWQSGIITDLGVLPGLSFSEARAVNNRGQGVGDSTLTGGPPFHAALRENGGDTASVALPPRSFSSPRALHTPRPS